MNTLTIPSRSLLSIAGAIAMLALAGCGQDSPTDPMSSGSGTYDGTWTCATALGPRWSLSFEVADDDVVHVDASYFVDELRCLRSGTATLTPLPPEPIVNDAFRVSGIGAPAMVSIDLAGQFSSPATATGTITVIYREPGNQDCDETYTSAFTAVRS